MRLARVRPLAFAAILSTVVAAAGAAVAAGQERVSAAPADATSADYRFVGTPALTYSHSTYGLVFRLNRDLPRARNRRARAELVIGDQGAAAVLGGGKRQRCFMAHVEGISGGPRFGKLYPIELQIPGLNTVRKRVRLMRATPGYEAFYPNGLRDPKVALRTVDRVDARVASSDEPPSTRHRRVSGPPDTRTARCAP